MASFPTRSIERHSLFIMADAFFDGAEEPQRVTVRNVSAGGLMAECDRRVKRGQRVVVTLRTIGQVMGLVVWTRMPRFGIAFDEVTDGNRAPVPAWPAPNTLS